MNDFEKNDEPVAFCPRCFVIDRLRGQGGAECLEDLDQLPVEPLALLRQSTESQSLRFDVTESRIFGGAPSMTSPSTGGRVTGSGLGGGESVRFMHD